MSLFSRLEEILGLDQFDKRHKTAFVLLAIAAIFIILMWVVQLRKNIVNPLYGGLNPESLTTNQTSNTNDDLKNKDTDQDGLSDYDELNVYKTSPYLNDSDSDGINDRDEIQKGSDPNCPTGQTCATANVGSQATTQNNLSTVTTTNTITGTTTPSTGSGSSQLSDEEKQALKQILGSSNDPATLRNFLLQSGADKNYVNSISDADLTKVINEILK